MAASVPGPPIQLIDGILARTSVAPAVSSADIASRITAAARGGSAP